MRYRPFISAEAQLKALDLKAAANEQGLNSVNSVPTGGATGQVLTKDSGTDNDVSWQTPSSGADLKPYCATGSGSDIPDAATRQDLSTEQITDSNYSLSGDRITITDAGTYLVSYSIIAEQDTAAGGTRGTLEAYMELDSGSGGSAITQSYNAGYTRESSGEAGGGVSNTFLVEVTAGDIIDLWTRNKFTGAPDMSADSTQVSILKVA